MNVPIAAQKMIDSFKSQGSLGQGAARSPLAPEQAKEIDRFSQTIEHTAEADNAPYFDLNPKKGELLIEDPEFTTEILVNGNSLNGSMTQATVMRDLTAVLFLEANDQSLTVFSASLNSDGSLRNSEGIHIDRRELSNSYYESVGPREKSA